MDGICSCVEDGQRCLTAVFAKGLCNKHYNRLRRHGDPLVNLLRKHGESRKTPEYVAWAAIQYRCYNPNSPSYGYYGGAGVAVCDRWLNSFESFLEDMGRRPSADHSIDRFPDPNGNYEPGNCRWATREEQGNNKRNNVLLTLRGETRTLAEWGRITGISDSALRHRLARGWTHERALTTPMRT